VARVTLASGLTLAYTDRGDASDPLLLLLPGPTDSWRSYEPVLERLPRDVRAVAVSQRGHGESDKPETGYAVEDFATDVVLLLDALAAERAVLAGHSGSCLVARRVALDRPDRVAGLILEASPTTLRGHPQLVEFADSIVSTLTDPISRDFARSFVAATSSNRISPDVVDLAVEELLQVPARVWTEMFSELLRYDDLGDLALVSAPTLLIWGDADAVVTRAMQHHLVQSIPAAHLLVYPGIGHTPRWEDPGRFARDVGTFVRNLD
jgi:pimeloyl-ACP methyl ester carboxylesterase